MSTAATPSRDATDVLIALAPPGAFATLRSLFLESRFDEATVAARLGLTSLTGLTRLADGRPTLAGAIEDTNAALVRLFIDGGSLRASLVRTLLGEDAWSACQALGVLRLVDGDEAAVAPTVTILPLHGLWLASDVFPTGETFAATRRDYVFSAGSDLTAEFLSVIPAAPGARVIELCAGTGVAALRAARDGASAAIAADVAPRCVHFSRFNALLNGLQDRVTAVRSDAWDGVAGETFDLAVAHPPYVPALAHRFDFRDAGEDGEQVTRRLVEGAPAHLRRGGRMIVRAALSDRRGATIAQRIRAWLGAASDEFDLVQLEAFEYGAFDTYKSVTQGGHGFVDCERWLRHFHALGIERFALCLLELRRDAYGRPPVTEVRRVGLATTPAVADWHFAWARYVAAAGESPEARIAHCTPRVAAGVRVAVHLESDGAGGWKTVGSLVETKWPSHGMVKAPALVPTLLELCDGGRDVDAILAGLRRAGLVDESVGRGDVSHLVEILLAAGALEISNCPLPARPAGGAQA